MPSPCSVTVTERGGVTVASLAGELDLATAADAFDQVALAARGRFVVVDLTGVTFIDSIGISQIVLLARRTSIRLVLAPGFQPERVLNITGIPEAIPCFASIDDAMRYSIGA